MKLLMYQDKPLGIVVLNVKEKMWYITKSLDKDVTVGMYILHERVRRHYKIVDIDEMELILITITAPNLGS